MQKGDNGGGWAGESGALDSMASGDIYVQVTATPDGSGRPKSVIVLVPWKNIEENQIPGKKPEAIAQQLADPLAMNVFTHRASFGKFKVAHSFSSDPLPEIESRLPDFALRGLKAWVL
jgi:hypothetical protein